MNERWWENPVCWLCNYWWVLLLIIIILIVAFIARDLWLPVIGLSPGSKISKGEVQVTLTWETGNDLDLWVTAPSGEKINFVNRNSVSGGIFEQDSNSDCEIAKNPIENIYWSTGNAPSGEYKVEVLYYDQCDESAETDFKVKIKIDNEFSEHQGRVTGVGDRVEVASFTK